MKIKHWPQDERPREKLLRYGEQALSDAELIAILLKSGKRGKTAVDVARELLNESGSIKQLYQQPAPALIKKSGIGIAKCASLKAGLELGRRAQVEQIKNGEVLNNSRKTQRFLADRLRNYSHEVFACLFMDTKLRFLDFEEFFHGTIDETSIYPRIIIKHALDINAAKIILAHNHPSGHAQPSSADQDITLLLRQALSYIDVELVDHIIVGNPDNFSFVEMGLI